MDPTTPVDVREVSNRPWHSHRQAGEREGMIVTTELTLLTIAAHAALAALAASVLTRVAGRRLPSVRVVAVNAAKEAAPAALMRRAASSAGSSRLDRTERHHGTNRTDPPTR